MFYFFLFAISFISLAASDNTSNAANIDLDAFSYFKNLQKLAQIDPNSFAYFRALQEPVIVIPIAVQPQITDHSYSHENVNNLEKASSITKKRRKRNNLQKKGTVLHMYQPTNDNYKNVHFVTQEYFFTSNN